MTAYFNLNRPTVLISNMWSSLTHTQFDPDCRCLAVGSHIKIHDYQQLQDTVPQSATMIGFSKTIGKLYTMTSIYF